MQKLNENDKKMAEFACDVCHKKMRREQPQAIDCAWMGIDNEYCPDVMEALAGEYENPYDRAGDDAEEEALAVECNTQPAEEPEWKKRMMQTFLGGR